MINSYNYPVNAILILGPTGAGKSPLGDMIARNGLFQRQCYHLDFGSELRRAMVSGDSSAIYSKDEIEIIRGVLERGLLLENEHFPLAKKIISLFLNRVGFNDTDILVLNGIPRHAGQANDISTIATIHALIILDCPADAIAFRIRDNVGGDRTERVDDDITLIGNKLEIFQQRTAPLIEHYAQENRSLYRINITTSMTPAETFKNVSALTAVHPPFTLVAEPPKR